METKQVYSKRMVVLGMLVGMLVAGSLLFATSASGPTVREPFVDPFSPNYVIWGLADPFNRVDAFEGTLELEGSYGFEGFGIYMVQRYDLAKGPVKIAFDMVRDSSNIGSEICVWFVNQYLPDGSPWDEADFVRVMFTSEGNRIVLQETSPAQRGMGTVLAEAANAFQMGNKYHVEFVVDASTAQLYLDGKKLCSRASTPCRSRQGMCTSMTGTVSRVMSICYRIWSSILECFTGFQPDGTDLRSRTSGIRTLSMVLTVGW